MALYRLFLIHSDRDRAATELQRAIKNHLNKLRIDPNLLQVATAVSSVTRDELGIGVYLASSKGASDRNCLDSIAQLQKVDLPIIPVVFDSDRFSDTVPPVLHSINAFTGESLDTIAAALLRWLGLTERHRRVFVSYRRSDALLIGEQIWETLSKVGFDVFLDRFSVEPGFDFQERLIEALSDKAFLLLIESPESATSPWIDYEIEYARKGRMGLFALTWPSGRVVKNIFDKQRYFLNSGDIVVKKGYSLLSDKFCGKLAGIVEREHAEAMLGRRRRLMGSVITELGRHNISFGVISDWTLVTTSPAKTRGEDHVISITPRPPEIPEFCLF
jgi:TIR domain